MTRASAEAPTRTMLRGKTDGDPVAVAPVDQVDDDDRVGRHDLRPRRCGRRRRGRRRGARRRRRGPGPEPETGRAAPGPRGPSRPTAARAGSVEVVSTAADDAVVGHHQSGPAAEGCGQGPADVEAGRRPGSAASGPARRGRDRSGRCRCSARPPRPRGAAFRRRTAPRRRPAGPTASAGPARAEETSAVKAVRVVPRSKEERGPAASGQRGVGPGAHPTGRAAASWPGAIEVVGWVDARSRGTQHRARRPRRHRLARPTRGPQRHGPRLLGRPHRGHDRGVRRRRGPGRGGGRPGSPLQRRPRPESHGRPAHRRADQGATGDRRRSALHGRPGRGRPGRGKRLQRAITSVADCPKPVIAAIHGYCIGGGVDLVSACDIRLASADAVFSVRETKVAIVADLGSLQRLPRIIGKGHVAELAYTGKDITAARAREIGLVNDVLRRRRGRCRPRPGPWRPRSPPTRPWPSRGPRPS